MVLGDNTLDFVCQNIKYRFKYLIWFITWNVAITISTSISLLYTPLPNTENTSYFYRVFCNEFLLSLIFGIALILIYSLMVINPNVIEKEAEKLKKRLSRNSSVSGSVIEFIINYRNLVEKCTQMLPENLRKQIEENKGKNFDYTLELLKELRPELKPLLYDLYRIHRYYECMINCKTMSVSIEICETTKKILSALK